MIQKVGVVGAGMMGHSIAETFALHGYQVHLYEPIAERLRQAQQEIEEELTLMAAEQLIRPDDVRKILDNIIPYSELQPAVADRDYVIETAPEDLKLKQGIFSQLDKICRPETIFASNTSSLPLGEMMSAVSAARRERMIVCHWFNPAHLIPLVELSYFGNMPPEVFHEVELLFRSVKKQTIKVRKDVPGLVANRIMQGVAREVFSLVDMGVADASDVDRALKFGPAFRYATAGQLEVSDFGGLDLWCAVADSLLKVMDDSRSANKLLREKVKEGKLGVKSGEGFFKYDPLRANEMKIEFMRRLIRQLRTSESYM